MVASFLGTTRQAVAAFERDERAPDLKQAVGLANLYRLTLDSLVQGTAPTVPVTGTRSVAMLARLTQVKGLKPDDLRELQAFHAHLRLMPKRVPVDFQLRALESIGDTVSRLRDVCKIRQATPTPIFKVAEQFGLEVRFTALDTLSGALVVGGERYATGILVNSDQPQERQRFSLGHELAHFILAHSPKGSVSFLGRRFERDEVDADSFAGELLVPTDLLKVKIQSLSDKDIDVAVLQLSRDFAVSFQAMVTRLGKIGALRPGQRKALEKVKPGELSKRLPEDTTKVPFKETWLDEFAATSLPTSERRPNVESVRQLQEAAVFHYFARVTEVRAAESAASVYERVACWVARNMPMIQAAS